MTFNAPALEYGALAPMLVIFVGAIIGVIAEAFLPARLRSSIQLSIALGTVVLALAKFFDFED